MDEQTFKQLRDMEIRLLRVEANIKEMQVELDKRTFTVIELARLMNKSERTIRRYVHMGLLTPIKGTMTFSSYEVARYLKGKRR